MRDRERESESSEKSNEKSKLRGGVGRKDRGIVGRKEKMEQEGGMKRGRERKKCRSQPSYVGSPEIQSESYL